jgi:hypothetical protein
MTETITPEQRLELWFVGADQVGVDGVTISYETLREKLAEARRLRKKGAVLGYHTTMWLHGAEEEAE